MIRHAKISEINHILKLAKACAAAMEAKGIYQWNAHYPSKAAFVNDIERNELYVLLLNNAIIGTVVISTFMDKEYKPIAWSTPNGNNIYIHRLAVAPQYQGQGYAQQLMDYAEAYARNHGFAAVRLDTFSQNKRNQQFYERRGYQRLGTIAYPKQSKHPFYCYEFVF